MGRRREVRKEGACHESCYVFICMYGKKREKLCDFSCFKTGKSHAGTTSMRIGR